MFLTDSLYEYWTQQGESDGNEESLKENSTHFNKHWISDVIVTLSEAVITSHSSRDDYTFEAGGRLTLIKTPGPIKDVLNCLSL